MTVRLSVQTRGLTVLALDPKELRKAMRQIGAEMRLAARQAVDRVTTKRSGDLRRRMKVHVFKSGQGVAIRSAALGTIRGGQIAYPYSHALEGGASGPGKRSLKARPFMSVALRAREQSIKQRIADYVERGIKFQRARGRLVP